jgi:hypothetical protein
MKFVPVVFFIPLCFCFPLYSQIDDETDYEILLAEVSLLFSNRNFDHNQSELLDSVSVSASRGEFEMARVYLELIINTIRDTSGKPGKELSPLLSREKDYELSLTTGVDYNRNEFELGLAQDDSVILEQVRKPFIGLQFTKKIFANRGLYLNSEIRYDQENISGNLRIGDSWQYNKFSIASELNGNYDNNRLYSEYSFRGCGVKQSGSWKISEDWQFRLNNQMQYKKYHNPSKQIPDYIRDYFQLEILNYSAGFSPVRVMYQIDFNESLQETNNDFLEHSIFGLGKIEYSNRYQNDIGMTYRRNRFAYSLEDTVFRNSSQTYQADSRNSLKVTAKIEFHLDYSVKLKKYITHTEQDPDYLYQLLNAWLQYQLRENTTFEFGGLYENQRHRVYPSVNPAYIKEQDYLSKGLLIGFEYTNFPSYLISVNCSFNQKRYPNTSDEALSIYTNRDILTFHLLIQAPIYQRLNLNIYGSYDNDRDLDSDESQIQSTYFSAEMRYIF